MIMMMINIIITIIILTWENLLPINILINYETVFINK